MTLSTTYPNGHPLCIYSCVHLLPCSLSRLFASTVSFIPFLSLSLCCSIPAQSECTQFVFSWNDNITYTTGVKAEYVLYSKSMHQVSM
ncbi:hypothetical protein BDV93DRAFT_56888 [Ceratobasidium sp. AG-I]|nr:hypothetical protein BDV93DRAFT_56888 [Ceratobasidium sp. AG-I]